MTSPEPTNTPDTEPTSAQSAASAAPAENVNPGPSLEEQLSAAKAEAAANHDRYLRSVADLENFRRRTVREKEELRQYAGSRVIEDLLPVIDNLALGITAARQPNANLKTLIDGVDMVLTQFKSALGNHGVKEVNPAGQLFDANLHEAVSEQPSADVPAGNVSTVVRIGYTLNGRLLRPAAVVVSSGSEQKETVI